MTHILAALFAASCGWWWGHSTARVVVRRMGGTYAQDRAAQDAQEQRTTGRHTASTITDDALDDLYARIETLEHVAAGNLRHVQAIVPELWRAEAAIERVRQLHGETCPYAHGTLRNGFTCSMCNALDEPTPAATEATHTKEQP